MNRKLLMLAIFTTLLFVSAEAKATIVDLTTANAVGGPVNGAYFSQGILGAAGSGNLDAFVRIQTNDPVEEGYNTDGRPVPFDENNSPIFTRAITIGAIPVITRSGIDYFEFLLDINEPNPSDKRLISLDEIKIYQSASGSFNTPTLASLGTLAYDLDLGSDSWIKLNGENAIDSGSGRADMIANIPVSLFNVNDMANQYVYLYSKFGSNIVNDGGFEEWGVDPDWIPLSNVPEPASLSLLGLGLLGLAKFRRKK